MSDTQALCRRGLESLDELLGPEATPEKDLIAEATRCLARYRDALIEEKRRGESAADPRLVDANALLSELVAGEFPLVGVRRKRIEQAREVYRRLLGEEAKKGS